MKKKQTPQGRKPTVLQDGMHRGFRKGVDAVPSGSSAKLKVRLKKLIGGSRSKLFYYINGYTIIQPEMSVKIEQIFSSYGIEPERIWDN